MNNAIPEHVGEIRAGLGEGPVWDASRNQLVWIDIERHRLYTTDVASGDTTHRNLPDAPGCVALSEGGALVLGIGQQLLAIDAGEGLQEIAALPPGSIGRFNDGKPDAAGRFWVGTATSDGHYGCSLWQHVSGQGFDQMAADISMSNGLGWSPDGTKLYYVDSMTHRIDVFDYDVATGSVSNRQPWAFLPDGQLPDGLCVDADGCVWLAVWGQSCVICFGPNGAEEQRIAVPTPLVTSCAFGAQDYRTLFITTACEDDDDPHAGRLFAVDTGSRGLPPNRIRLAQ